MQKLRVSGDLDVNVRVVASSRGQWWQDIPILPIEAAPCGLAVSIGWLEDTLADDENSRGQKCCTRFSQRFGPTHPVFDVFLVAGKAGDSRLALPVTFGIA